MRLKLAPSQEGAKMSDVGITSAPAAAPSAPSAPAGEAVINPSPVNMPSPIGPQSAPAAVPADFKGSEHHPQSRRETIAKAFERARTEPPNAARPKPGMGHNQPPEAMAREKPKPRQEPPLDLKKRPAEQTQPTRERGEHGHFAARDANRQQTRPGTPQQPRQGQGAPNPLPQHAPYREPPTRRMSPAAQRDWGHAPETVRADVHRMYKEFSTASARMRGAYQAMKPIYPYHQLAQQHGTTLDRALNNYVSMENKLRADPVGGLDVIINNLNLRTPDGQRLGLRDIAWHVLNQTPEAHKTLQMQNSQTAIAHQMGQLHAQQQAIAQDLQRLHYERQFSHTRGAVDRFAETHPRLDELGHLIEQELRLGFDLPTAYRRAELLKPGHTAAQTRNTTAQTRSSDRSISGAPDSSLNGGPRRQKTSASPREAVAKALQRVNGRI
jgi:hypothetical protein